MESKYAKYSDNEIMLLFGSLPKGVRRLIALYILPLCDGYYSDKENMLPDDKTYDGWDLDFMDLVHMIEDNPVISDFVFSYKRKVGLRRFFCETIRKNKLIDGLESLMIDK
jgi:hypothetical protein